MSGNAHVRFLEGKEGASPLTYSAMFQNYPDIVAHSDLCAMLSISRNSAYRLLKSGQIEYIKMGRKYLIPKNSVAKYILTQLG